MKNLKKILSIIIITILVNPSFSYGNIKNEASEKSYEYIIYTNVKKCKKILKTWKEGDII